MRAIPKKLRAELAADPDYSKCFRNQLFHDHICQPNPVTRHDIEWEHAFIYARKQINARWAIIPLCWYVHEGPGKNKRINQFLALSRASEEDLQEFPKVDWEQLMRGLRIYINDIQNSSINRPAGSQSNRQFA